MFHAKKKKRAFGIRSRTKIQSRNVYTTLSSRFYSGLKFNLILNGFNPVECISGTDPATKAGIKFSGASLRERWLCLISGKLFTLLIGGNRIGLEMDL